MIAALPNTISRATTKAMFRSALRELDKLPSEADGKASCPAFLALRAALLREALYEQPENRPLCRENL